MSIDEHGIYSKESQGIIDHAYRMAKCWHEGQFRRYTGEPYVIHCIEVAKIVSEVTECSHMICAALLHDVIEDCGVTEKDLADNGFGFGIERLVIQLTDISIPTDGNRKFRKGLDKRYLSRAESRAKTIKLADLISNSRTIIKYDPEFAKVYMKEKMDLMEVLRDGDSSLYKKSENIIKDYYGES